MPEPRFESVRRRFAELHEPANFILPNPWDVGSARLLETLGFVALATTSSGFAASLGRMDMATSRSELVDHVASLTSAVALPVNVDAAQELLTAGTSTYLDQAVSGKLRSAAFATKVVKGES